MTALLVWGCILWVVLWIVKTYGNRWVGTSLPPGYRIETWSEFKDGSERLRLYHNQELIATSNYVVAYGYRSCARTLGRAAWTHHAMTRVEDAA